MYHNFTDHRKQTLDDYPRIETGTYEATLMKTHTHSNRDLEW